MKVMHKRLGRLEDRLIPRPSAESPLVALILERRRRRAEAEGRPYVEEFREDLSGPSLAQIIQRRRLARQWTGR
jgi:hypothetical protein